MGATQHTAAAEASAFSPPEATTAALAFIAKWQGVQANELSTAQSFTLDRCELLGKGPWKKGLPTLLQTLQALGRAQPMDGVEGEVVWGGD